MKHLLVAVIAISAVLGSSCSPKGASSAPAPDRAPAVSQDTEKVAAQGALSAASPGYVDTTKASDGARVQNASAVEPAMPTIPPLPEDRKIIRNAKVALEVQAPLDAQQRIGRIAEQHGGFVVTTETKQGGPKSGAGPSDLTVSITVRVPSTQFSAALTEIDSIAVKVESENVTGQDVTEEFVDLEARIRAKKALEAQFLEIMKQAHKVEDALEVQREIADVRGEIERFEGRKRYLENQSSLSTISITLQEPPSAPVVTAKWGITDSIKQAGSDAVETAAAILNTVIRLTGFLIPILALIAFPIWLLVRLFRAGVRIRRKAIQVADGQ